MGEEPALRLPAIRRLHQLTARLSSGGSLEDTLQAVADGVVEGVGFRVAAVNVVHLDGTFEAVAVSGSDEARDALLGRREPADCFDVEFARAEEWGALRFVPHDRLPPEEVVGWVPDLPVPDDPDAWHPLDALFAPLLGASGELVGMLSVDLPEDGRRPGLAQRELLEMFAGQAGIAIANARLTEQLRQEHARLQASETSFRLAFDASGTAMAMISHAPADEGRFLRVNGAFAALTGYDVEELVNRSVSRITHPEDRRGDLQVQQRVKAGERTIIRGRKRYVRRDGGVVWVAVTSSVVEDADGEPLYAINQYADITESLAEQERLTLAARTDPLTGLANRTALLERLAATTRQPSGGVLFCDLDSFKTVNDGHGHAAGDEVLRVAALRLQDCVRDEDLVARLGGDEFVVVAEGVEGDDLTALAERIRTAMAQPVEHSGTRTTVTVSIGVCEWTPGDQLTCEELIDRSDAAMYDAKAAGRDAVRVASR